VHNRPRGLSFLLEHRTNVECDINGTMTIHVAARLHERAHRRLGALECIRQPRLHWSIIRKNASVMNAPT
jgi:hypothetical protein